MKLYFKITLCLLTILTGILPIESLGQNPPAETYQPGYWQPVARFNTKKSVEVKLINQTKIPLEYDLTDLESINPQELNPGKTGILNSFGDSGYIVIYPKISVDPDNPITLKFTVEVSEDNIVMVKIKKSEPNFLGHRAINLQKNGGIYLY
ncbi:MAG TPA: hypothetical protein DCF68_11435 [Cyanothece sp. UBA12306]|nr:hypothetical protein [Cyanothece sp. UBA12306]